MKTSIAVLAALLLAPCACTRHEQAPAQPIAYQPIDPGPAVEPTPPAEPAAAPAVAEPEPQPSAEELAAFRAPVSK